MRKSSIQCVKCAPRPQQLQTTPTLKSEPRLKRTTIIVIFRFYSCGRTRIKTFKDFCVLRPPYRQSSTGGRLVQSGGCGGPGVAEPQPETRGGAAGHRPTR